MASHPIDPAAVPATGPAARPPGRAPVRPRIYAHRGSTLLAPENTALAFDLALGFGADVLETDVRLARDGVVMVVHDDRLERTTDGRGRVRDLGSADVARLDAGARFTDLHGAAWRGRGARIEPLDALLERYPEVAINVDIKDADGAAADAVAASIARCAAQARVTVGSFHGAVLARFRDVAPGVATAAGQAEVAALYFRPRAPRRVPYRYLQIPPSWFGLPLARPGFIARAAALGVDTVYWTIDDPARMRELVRRGATGIVTDRADVAAATFGRAAGGRTAR